MVETQGTPLSGAARERIRIREVDQLYWTVRTGLRCLTVAFILWAGFRAVEVLAGQDTKVNVALALVFTALVELKVAIFIALTGASTAWAVVERTLRHRKVEQMQARIHDLEQHLDPNRSSSNLTLKGKTNPEDKRR
jgi:hypothetical protein